MRGLFSTLVLLVILLTNCKKAKPVRSASVTTAPVTNITANSAESGGTITDAGNLPVSHVGVCWATHAAPTIADSVSSGAFGNINFTVDVTNLNANTTYYLRAFAENEAGTGYGNEMSFVTSKGVPTVVTADISNNQGLQVQTGGNVINDGGDTVTATGVCWSITPQPTIADSHIVNPVPGTGLFTDTITNLDLTTYYVRAFATNSYGTTYGNEISFTVSATATVSDIEGNVYPTVMFGTQTWMATNLRVTHYQNGDSIINGLTGFDWGDSATGAFTFPNGDTTNDKVYGKLYNIYAVNDPRNIAPQGWHVATDSDWQVLEFYEGMSASDTGALNERGIIGAKFLPEGSSGLNLLNAGIIDPTTGTYLYFGARGYYWTSTPGISGQNWFRAFNTITGDPAPIYRSYNNLGQAVRCVRN